MSDNGPEPAAPVEDTYEVIGGKHYHEGEELTAGATFHPTHRQVEGGSLAGKARKVKEGSSVSSSVPADIGIRALPMTDRALEIALGAGLSEEDFEGVEPKGADGDYLTGQVRDIIAGREE